MKKQAPLQFLNKEDRYYVYLVSLIQQTEQTISAIPDFFHERLLRKCNWTKPAPLMTSVGDLSLEQTGSSLHLVFNLQFAYLCNFTDWSMHLWPCMCVPRTYPRCCTGTLSGHATWIHPTWPGRWVLLRSSCGGHNSLGRLQQRPCPPLGLGQEVQASGSPHLPAVTELGTLAGDWARQLALCSCGMQLMATKRCM